MKFYADTLTQLDGDNKKRAQLSLLLSLDHSHTGSVQKISVDASPYAVVVLFPPLFFGCSSNHF